MGFLTRLLKTPDEDQEEEQDEFNAEQNGLLMAPSLPSDKAAAAPAETPGADDLQAEVPAAEGGPASPRPQGEAMAVQDEVAQPSEGEVDPSNPTDQSPPAQSQVQQTPPEEAQAEPGSSDDPLALFRAIAAHQISVSPALKEGLEDVSAADLLAEALSIRNSLLGGQATGQEAQRSREAA